MAILTLSGLVQKLQTYATLQLLGGLLIDNQRLCRDRGQWRTVVRGVKELCCQDPNVSHDFLLSFVFDG